MHELEAKIMTEIKKLRTELSALSMDGGYTHAIIAGKNCCAGVCAGRDTKA